MNSKEILKDLGARTNGDVYLGIVGPVRTGKSTFIKKFMELAVVPSIMDEYVKARTIDELPQSGEGKTITTTEPKFVPSTAANVSVGDDIFVKVRLVDCVGFVIKDAKGYMDEQKIRMVKTPWFEDSIPFDEAAKIGTEKIIKEHSSIGIVITSDGSICDIERENYIEAEEQVINELLDIGKPFIVIVNSKDPNSGACQSICTNLKEKYNVPCFALNISTLSNEDVTTILKSALYEFPVAKIDISYPMWVGKLNKDHWLRKSIEISIENSITNIKKAKEVETLGDYIKTNEYVTKFDITNFDVSKGYVNATIEVLEDLYEKVLNELAGDRINSKDGLLAMVQEYSNLKEEFESIGGALEMAKQTGYGYTNVNLKDLKIDRPILSKQGNRYGIKLNASLPTWHIIKVDVETTFEPIMGCKEQADYILESLCSAYDEEETSLLESQLFGRKVKDVLKDGISSKLSTIPEASKLRLQSIVKTLSNKGKGTLIAFII